MKAEFAFLAEAVKSRPDGVLDALGIGTDFLSGENPVFKPDLVLVARVSFAKNELGQSFQFVLRCTEPNGGTRRNPLSVTAIAQPIPDAPEQGWVSLIFNMPGSLFELSGQYTFHLCVGESTKSICDVPLTVTFTDRKK